MLKFKGLPGTADPYVKIALFDHRTAEVLESANTWSILTKKTVHINAIDNGVHGAVTLHGVSLAWDLGIEGSQRDDYMSLAGFLSLRLAPPYEIIVEADHIHVEWDTHKGRGYDCLKSNKA